MSHHHPEQAHFITSLFHFLDVLLHLPILTTRLTILHNLALLRNPVILQRLTPLQFCRRLILRRCIMLSRPHRMHLRCTRILLLLHRRWRRWWHILTRLELLLLLPLAPQHRERRDERANQQRKAAQHAAENRAELAFALVLLAFSLGS